MKGDCTIFARLSEPSQFAGVQMPWPSSPEVCVIPRRVANRPSPGPQAGALSRLDGASPRRIAPDKKTSASISYRGYRLNRDYSLQLTD